MNRKRVEPWFLLGVALVVPPLTLLTRREWRGRDHVPRSGAVILCTNHISYLDPLVFAHFVLGARRRPRFLVKSSLFTVPVGGRILRGARQIPVHRESSDASRALASAERALADGDCVVIYPEATITVDPGVWPMVGKTGAARLALATGAPVVPVAQWGAQALLSPDGTRWSLFPRHTMRVQAGPPVPLEDLRDRALDADVLHTATERIMTAVTALLEDVRGEKAPVQRYDSGGSDADHAGVGATDGTR